MKRKTKRVVTDLPIETHDQLKIKCIKRGKILTELFKELIMRWLKDE